MKQIEEDSDILRATQIEYVRALLRNSFPADSELVESLNLGGINGSSIESRASFIQTRDSNHFNTFCGPYLRGIAERLGRYDLDLLEPLIGPENDFLNGLIKDSLKLFYASKYPDKVRCWAYEI